MKKAALKDVQAEVDTRNFAIDKVGIKELILPLKMQSRDGRVYNVTAKLSGYNYLSADQRGTHMSRYIRIFNEFTSKVLNRENFNVLLKELEAALSSDIFVEIDFVYFKEKISPVSKLSSFLNYNCGIKGEINSGKIRNIYGVNASIMSLCPASKAISEKNAHNQRGIVSVFIESDSEFDFEQLIELIEKHSSCEIYGLLKLEDEKYVTERAYENAKFVEDTVRDLAKNLCQHEEFKSWSVSCENFESIHTHNAYAEINSGDF